MRKICCLLCIVLFFDGAIFCQTTPINRQQFFLDDRVIEVSFTTDLRKLRNDKAKPVWLPATIEMHFSDTEVVKEEVRVEPRGVDRKANCDLASLMLNFKNETSPLLSPLKKLKFVSECRSSSLYEDLLLKEFLVYKIYNFLTPMSFRVRLMHLTFNDSKQRSKPHTQYAFLIEDLKDLSERNNCFELKKEGQYSSHDINDQEMTLVCVFQYMIGNTDWGVQKFHNIRLMLPKNDTAARPYAIAYDFDFSGLVNAPYAIPNDGLGINSVLERLYRGYPCSEDELKATLDVFKEKKDAIMFYVQNFPLLEPKTKQNVVKYLEEFYKTVNDKRSAKSTFIKNARTD